MAEDIALDRTISLAYFSFACALLLSDLSAQKADSPNLILITVDALRADHLGCYGYPGKISPAVDELARQGVVFKDAVTPIGKTAPAFISLFTSQYPPTTGARRNGLRLQSSHPLLAQILKQAEYSTGAVISNWTLKNRLSGLGKGFDHYDDDFSKTRAGPIATERLAPEVTAKALAWLEEHPQEPVFLWVHYSDPHSPYLRHEELGFTPATEINGRSVGRKASAYAEEVRFTDHWIERFLDKARPLVGSRKTFWVFSSDHGESLGEHKYWGHGKNVYQPTIRVPLILAGPGIPAGKRLQHQVSLIDLMPTFIEWAGATASKKCRGTSLAGIWNCPADARLRYAFSGRKATLVFRSPRRYRHPPTMCLMQDNWKVIYNFRYDFFSAIDLKSDPRELKLFRKLPEATTSLAETLKDWYAALPKYRRKGRKSSELTQEDLAKLKSLGY